MMRIQVVLALICFHVSISKAQTTNSFPTTGNAILAWNNRLIVGTGTLVHPSVEANNWTRIVLSHNLYWDNGNANWVIQGGGSSDFSMMRYENGGGISFYARPHYGNGYTLTNTELEAYRHLSINSNGNVGIGTAVPTEKLSVKGKIRAQEIKVETSNWADYVFRKDYQLSTLSEIEAYIQEHQHLPGIPSEEEVKKEGISLGEMNKKLLEKVEELTLHLIEKEKKEKRYEDAISKLEDRLNRLENINK